MQWLVIARTSNEVKLYVQLELNRHCSGFVEGGQPGCSLGHRLCLQLSPMPLCPPPQLLHNNHQQGVGSHAAHLLLRSGVGRLRLVDFDQVTLSSLNRHAVAVRADVGIPKATCLQQHFKHIMPEVSGRV